MNLGLIGDRSSVDIDLIHALDIVADVKRTQESYKNTDRKFHPDDTVIVLNGGIKIGAKLESRPIPGEDFRFSFYFDFDASVYSPDVISLLSDLEVGTENFTFLGAYREV